MSRLPTSPPRHTEQPPPRQRLWYWLEFIALAATIPAFYVELLRVSPLLGWALYGFALVVCSIVAWREGRATRQHHKAQQPWRLLQSAALILGLALSVLLPEGEAALSLSVRLATALLTLMRLAESLRPWFWRGGLFHLLAIALGVLGLCGAGFWWLEPRATSLADGLWLAFTTAATVGYGDIVPSTPASKIFSVFVVLLGFAVLSLVTAAIAAMWVETEERRIEREILNDMHKQLQQVHAELASLREQIKASTQPAKTN